uniref:Annexin D4 n=1 Tax=Cucumis melo TaxID=3656 RepID=A0A9I9D3P7_CUCME
MGDYDYEHLFLGIGIDEKKLIEMVGRSDFNAANIKRKRQLMMIEFQRFMNATLMWMTSPAERDARLLRKAIKTRGTRVGIMVIIEIACTREFCDVSAAKEVYHHLYKNSLEFDLSRFIIGPEQTLLNSLLNTKRFKETNEEEEKIVMLDAETLAKAFNDKSKIYIENREIINILMYRSIPHLCAVYEQCKKMGVTSKLLENSLAFKLWAVEDAEVAQADVWDEDYHLLEDSLSRIIISRLKVDLDKIKIKFKETSKITLQERIRLKAARSI